MRSLNNTTTTTTASASGPTALDSGFRHWNSPVPYLCSGVALVLCLIMAALVILACTSPKSSSNSSSSSSSSSSLRPNSGATAAREVGDNGKEIRQPEVVVVDSDRPKVVVIMAGDDKPTYLANPTLDQYHHHELQGVESNN